MIFSKVATVPGIALVSDVTLFSAKDERSLDLLFLVEFLADGELHFVSWSLIRACSPLNLSFFLLFFLLILLLKVGFSLVGVDIDRLAAPPIHIAPRVPRFLSLFLLLHLHIDLIATILEFVETVQGER
jgi:hypothetical protein